MPPNHSQPKLMKCQTKRLFIIEKENCYMARHIATTKRTTLSRSRALSISIGHLIIITIVFIKFSCLK